MEKIIKHVTGAEIVDDRPELVTFILPKEVVESVNKFLTAILDDLETAPDYERLNETQMVHSVRIMRIATRIALEVEDELEVTA